MGGKRINYQDNIFFSFCYHTCNENQSSETEQYNKTIYSSSHLAMKSCKEYLKQKGYGAAD